jgi:uncharacterized protein with von Willebrand factor type A (vWA) domain
MVDQIVEFSHLLRSRGIRVSVSENMDAARALPFLRTADLYQLKSALRCTLVKQPADFRIFDELFDFFFLDLGNARADFGKQAKALAQAEASESRLDPATLRKLIQQLEPLLESLKGEISLLAQALLTADAEKLQSLLEQAFKEQSAGSAGMVLGVGLSGLLDELEWVRATAGRRGLDPVTLETLSHYLDQQIRDIMRRIHRMVQAGPAEDRAVWRRAERPESLYEKSFAYYTQEDIHRMKQVVAGLALRFKSLLSIRRKKADLGRLDVKSTLRKNQQHGGVPFKIQLRRRKKEKPQVMILCDISDSVMNASRFMLQFVYSMQELYSKVRSFVFVSDLGEVTDLFSDNAVDQAVDMALKGKVVDVFVHSNFGRSFKLFYDGYSSAVNSKTTVVILGDGRNNYHLANEWVLREIQQRAKQLIWLNPESRLTWSVGDSEMPSYIPYCDVVEECRNIEQLTRIVERLMP